MKPAKIKKQKKNKINLNIRKSLLKFDNISYEQWKELVPNVLNYELQLANIETLDHMILLKKQLEAYIDCKGIVPQEFASEVKKLKEDELEIKKMKKDLSIAEVDTSFKARSEEELKELEKIVDVKLINFTKFDESKKAYLYFRNPFFLEGEQHFNERLSSLKTELSGYDWIINKKLMPTFKKSQRMMDIIAVDIRRILKINDPTVNINPLIYFIRPHIDQIINSENYYYQELIALSL